MHKTLAVLLFMSFAFFTRVEAGYERIDSFTCDITVNADSSLDVAETINYDSDGLEKHGIFRDIRLKAYNGDGLGISRISVADENGKPHKFTKKYSSGQIKLRIGDPDRTFSGRKIYVIKYKINGALGDLEKLDEIYWNATGNNWPFPIEQAAVHVHLPDGAREIQSKGYYGYGGSGETFQGDGKGNFYFGKKLLPGQGVTVAVGFAKGRVKHKPNLMKAARELFKFLFLVMPVFAFIFMFRQWNLYGRDPVSGRPIVPQYDVPDGLTPLEAAGVARQAAGAKEISAEIVYLAVNGYLTIEKTEEKILFVKISDYILRKIPNDKRLSAADEKIMSGLFGGGSEVKLSSLREVFYMHIPVIIHEMFEKITHDGHYRGNPQKAPVKYVAAGFAILGAAMFMPAVPFIRELDGISLLIFIAGTVISTVIIFIFAALMPVRTDKGVLARDHLLGLKEYLDIAEKDRINFHNAPEKRPEVFEKFLPYAMIFGLEKAWAKEFEGIYTEPGKWYSDRGMSAFSAGAFAGSLRGFSDSAGSTLTSSPSSSGGGGGSGGGGSSGGGGGGGGGGSW